MFKDNADVVFGDINLSENRITGNHNPGAGGWPTIRYFNKATGYEGGSYEKKTSSSMCDELGPGKPFMQQYVEEYGHTSLCSISTGKGCTEKEVAFAKKWSGHSAEEVASELGRLAGMLEGSMKADLKDWVSKRVGVLKQISGKHEEL
mmetsp:Transcript_29141/g.82164  ORF Transcript_29141/g.82164 Transcript_29141/m.82164 type:complete len:148 (-) Transcript_29141:182-625(-)